MGVCWFMRKQIMLLAISLAVLGLFIIPMTLSMFVGQHQFVRGADVECDRCHFDVQSEILAGNVHRGLACSDCHAIDLGGSNKTHAAYSPACLDCHAEPALGRVDVELSNPRESHRAYYESALAQDIELDANEACISCHTNIKMEITWKNAEGLGFDARHGLDGWIIDDWRIIGSVTKTKSEGEHK